MQASTKKYVDDAISAGSRVVLASVGTQVAEGASNTDIAATLASTSGFLTCTAVYVSGSDKVAYATGLSDSNATPTTILGYATLYHNNNPNSIHRTSYEMFVKKGEYYKCIWTGESGDNMQATRVYHWLPWGN
jgi:hypothetical protein